MVLFSAYVAYIWKKFGMLSSISFSSYMLTGKKRYIFTFWLWSLAIITYFQGLELWGDVMMVGFIIAGITLDHRKSPDLEDELHTIGTAIAIVSGFLGLHVLHDIWKPTAIMAFGSCLSFFAFPRKWIWCVEILAMITIGIGLLLR